MKTIAIYLMTAVAIMLSLPCLSQNNVEPVALGLPGDNFNLYAVLDIFQKSPTLESFERAINEKDNKINNLDLNNDKTIDYVEVKSSKNGNTHLIVLQTAINSKEYQDIAVIDVHKNAAGKVIVQIVGDEVLYGKDYIVEPVAESNISETPNPGYTGSGNQSSTNVTINNYSNGIYYANDWPIVGLLYSPGFALYISPWHWGLYPSWWYPWAPIAYYDYWGYHYHYYNMPYYRRCAYVRYPDYYHHYSTSRRSYSPTVVRYRSSGRYDNTYAGRTYRKPAAPVAEPNRAGTRPSAPATSGNRAASSARRATVTEPLRVNPPVNTRVAKPSIEPNRSALPSTSRSNEAARRAVPPSKSAPSTTKSAPSTTRPSTANSRPDATLSRPARSADRPDASLPRSAAPAPRSISPAAPPISRPAPAARPMGPPRPIMPGVRPSGSMDGQSARNAPQQSRQSGGRR